MRLIPIDRITDELDGDDALTAIAIAMEDLAIMQALVLIHGTDRGIADYIKKGGRVRFTADGEPAVLWPET